MISIHALVKRATFRHSNYKMLLSYFNPRPREEGDVCRPGNEPVPAISIHALVKRATIWYKYEDGDNLISIHALVKRATV